jgi:hypothetical protein
MKQIKMKHEVAGDILLVSNDNRSRSSWEIKLVYCEGIGADTHQSGPTSSYACKPRRDPNPDATTPIASAPTRRMCHRHGLL